MHPHGVDIEPEKPGLPDDVGTIGALRAVRGRGTGGHGGVEVELDALGDLVDVVVGEAALQSGATAVASAFAEAHRAARAATTAALEEHAEQITARASRERDANLERLEAIAARATAQFDEMAATLTRVAEEGKRRG